jgi:site-specific recombinase XerD
LAWACGSEGERLTGSPSSALKLLQKLPNSTIAELSGLSASYISQVKHGKCRPSKRLVEALLGSPYHKTPDRDYLKPFLESRQARGVTSSTLAFYEERIDKYGRTVDYFFDKASRRTIEQYLNTIQPNENGLGARHASYRALRVFYTWLHAEYGMDNPMAGVKAPILSKLILPSLTREQVQDLINAVDSARDKAVIALFAESGLRLSELSGIKAADINWQNHTIRVMGKGRKEALAPFGELSEAYLKEWIAEHQPNGSTVWGINARGVQIMLKRLQERTGVPCNPHTFRRTFAVLLRKAGVVCLTIRDLGRWETVSMVERYTRSFNFSDAMKFYKGTLGG